MTSNANRLVGAVETLQVEPDRFDGDVAHIRESMRTGGVEGDRVTRVESVAFEAQCDLECAAKDEAVFRADVADEPAFHRGTAANVVANEHELTLLMVYRGQRLPGDTGIEDENVAFVGMHHRTGS